MVTSRKIRIGIEMLSASVVCFLAGLSFGNQSEFSFPYALGFLSLYAIVLWGTLRETIEWYLEED